MELQSKRIENVIEVFLEGRLDVQLSADIEKEIEKIIKSEPDSHLLLNLKDIEYLSSSGIRIFVATMRTLKENGKELKLCELDSHAKQIFEIVELMDMFDIYDTEEEALNEFIK